MQLDWRRLGESVVVYQYEGVGFAGERAVRLADGPEVQVLDFCKEESEFRVLHFHLPAQVQAEGVAAPAALQSLVSVASEEKASFVVGSLADPHDERWLLDLVSVRNAEYSQVRQPGEPVRAYSWAPTMKLRSAGQWSLGGSAALLFDVLERPEQRFSV